MALRSLHLGHTPLPGPPQTPLGAMGKRPYLWLCLVPGAPSRRLPAELIGARQVPQSHTMKIIGFLTLLLGFGASALRADFLSPFADSKPGSTVTSNGEIVIATPPGSTPVYFVRFRTDTGPGKIEAEIPSELIRQAIAGRSARITVTIREREDPKTKAKMRFLEVLKIEFSK